jgi:hypothetical protein
MRRPVPTAPPMYTVDAAKMMANVPKSQNLIKFSIFSFSSILLSYVAFIKEN